MTVGLDKMRDEGEMTTLLASIVRFGVAGLGGVWLAGWLMLNIHTTLLPLMVSEWTITGVAGTVLYKCNVLYPPAYFMVLEACYYLRLMMVKGERPITFKQSQERVANKLNNQIIRFFFLVVLR